jgi:hypothetical protein
MLIDGVLGDAIQTLPLSCPARLWHLEQELFSRLRHRGFCRFAFTGCVRIIFVSSCYLSRARNGRFRNVISISLSYSHGIQLLIRLEYNSIVKPVHELFLFFICKETIYGTGSHIRFPATKFKTFHYSFFSLILLPSRDPL